MGKCHDVESQPIELRQGEENYLGGTIKYESRVEEYLGGTKKYSWCIENSISNYVINVEWGDS